MSLPLPQLTGPNTGPVGLQLQSQSCVAMYRGCKQEPADRLGWNCDERIRIDVDEAVASFIRWIEFRNEIAFIVLLLVLFSTFLDWVGKLKAKALL